MSRSLYEINGETCRCGEDGRSQSLHSTEAVKAARGAESKAASREGRQEGGSVIDGTKQTQAAEVPDVKVFHAGTARRGSNVVAVGGRVLGVTALGENVGHAKRLAYEAVDKIMWPGGFCRRDIGWRAVK